MIINNKLTEFDAKNVLNIDETALFWRTVAKKGLCFGDKAPKNQVFKDRVTVMCGASMLGEKLPQLIIGKSENPRNFGQSVQQQYANDPFRPLLYYNNSDSAWMTIKLFIKYLTALNNKFIKENRRVCILCDAPSIHLLGMLDENSQLIIQSFSNILLIYLPSNFTCVIQPLDQGIIRSLKAKYRFEMMKTLIYNARNYINNPNENLTTLKLTQQLTMYDAIKLLQTALWSIETSVITNCWIKSSIAGYWNITKMASIDKLDKLNEKQTLASAKSIFNDLDVQNKDRRTKSCRIKISPASSLLSPLIFIKIKTS